ncbi:MAG: bifunctional adenosylcobinamide kinase/adenosylcobinamide-phosphate guanylyltransferase [Pseudomonadota bacterium]
MTLVLGGIASGKSAYAECLFSGAPNRQYIATAQAFDVEMEEKIRVHQMRRGSDWVTHDAQIALPKKLASLRNQPVLVDCVTLWLSNLLLAEQPLENLFSELEAAIKSHEGHLVIVSNEVGHSPVATTSLGRKFQNAQGHLNQRLASISDKVVFVTAGLPQVIKA